MTSPCDRVRPRCDDRGKHGGGGTCYTALTRETTSRWLRYSRVHYLLVRLRKIKREHKITLFHIILIIVMGYKNWPTKSLDN